MRGPKLTVRISLTMWMLVCILGFVGPFIVAAFTMPSIRRRIAIREAKERQRPVDRYRLQKQLSSHDYLP